MAVGVHSVVQKQPIKMQVSFVDNLDLQLKVE